MDRLRILRPGPYNYDKATNFADAYQQMIMPSLLLKPAFKSTHFAIKLLPVAITADKTENAPHIPLLVIHTEKQNDIWNKVRDQLSEETKASEKPVAFLPKGAIIVNPTREHLDDNAIVDTTNLPKNQSPEKTINQILGLLE